MIIENKFSNVVWERLKITKEERENLNAHKPAILWFTGLPTSGKSTLASAVEEELYKRGVRTYVLDGDNIRHGLNKDLGFSPQDRKENIRRIGEVAGLFVDAGILVMVAFISPYREDRDNARRLVEKTEFIEIYIKCPLEVCEKRDRKGMYKRARAGEIPGFTGVSAPYEEPLNAEVVVETDRFNIQESVDIVIRYLEKMKIIGS